MEPLSNFVRSTWQVWISGVIFLNIARQWPGSVLLLKPQRAFCFCGTQGFKQDLNSIERLDKDWKILPLDSKIAHTFFLAAVQFESKIVVFGGSTSASFNTYILSDEGELEGDLSADPLVPGYMCRGSCVAQDGKIYAVGFKEVKGNWEWSLRVFDGKKWALE